jgi:surface polysaccharide O-acyltransferase-like enzyme
VRCIEEISRPAAIAADRRDSAAGAAPRPWMAGFDVLRLVSLAAIVAFHAGAPGSRYTAWRLPALTIISAALAAGRRRPRPLSEQARRSASRLLAPWAFWCAVYGIVDLATYMRLGTSIVQELGPRVLVTGASVHLWYLPFAFVMVMIVDAARRLTEGLPTAGTCALATGIAVAALVAVALEGSYRDDAGTPWPQWQRSIPAVFLGLAVGTATRRGSGRDMAVLASATASACAVIAVVLGDDLAARYGMAMVLVAAASTWRFDPPRWLAEAAGLAMGVYLIHMVIHRAIYFTSNRLPTPDLSPTAQALAAVALSFAAAWALSRTPLRRLV